MDSRADLNKLITYIEENLRASDDSGIDFIDPRNFRTRLMNKQNQVVYGRRGSGKTTIANSLKKEAGQFYVVKINMEDFKDISFPNVLIHVLSTFFTQIKKQILADIKWPKVFNKKRVTKIFNDIEKETKRLEETLPDPDSYAKSVKEKMSAESSGNIGVNKGPVTAGLEQKSKGEMEINKEVNVEKLDAIKNSLPSLKKKMQALTGLLSRQAIFLFLDDFYFLKKNEQPFFVDFFHRLSKDTPLFIKVATIKNRTQLYAQTRESYYGMELGHDAQALDLDYTLDRFDDLKNFMGELLSKACISAGVDTELTKQTLSRAGFVQLCLASGGVPRDFLSLFVKVASSVSGTIGKVEVTNASIANFPIKYESFKADSADERQELERYFNRIKKFVIEDNRTNLFLVHNTTAEELAEAKQAVKELVDLRMLHLVDSSTSSAPSDGKMYSAYMIDIGSYRNPKQRNFKQIEPGLKDEKSRKDNIRSAPKLGLSILGKQKAEDK